MRVHVGNRPRITWVSIIIYLCHAKFPFLFRPVSLFSIFVALGWRSDIIKEMLQFIFICLLCFKYFMCAKHCSACLPWPDSAIGTQSVVQFSVPGLPRSRWGIWYPIDRAMTRGKQKWNRIEQSTRWNSCSLSSQTNPWTNPPTDKTQTCGVSFTNKIPIRIDVFIDFRLAYFVTFLPRVSRWNARKYTVKNM